MSEPGLLLFLYTETPLHVGSGEGLGAIDLPIMREKLSDLPVVPGSGIKGALREVFGDGEDAADRPLTEALFGPAPTEMDGSTRGDDKSDAEAGDAAGATAGDATDDKVDDKSGATADPKALTFAGALTLLDARLLLLPVRSVFGGFAWVTGELAINRLARDLDLCGSTPGDWHAIRVAQVGDDQLPTAVVSAESQLSRKSMVLLEDLPYKAVVDKRVATLAQWLRDALPAGSGYAPFRERLAGHLMVVSDEEFSQLSRRAVEINTRVRIDRDTGTVKKGALWTEESLPAESLLWSVASFERSRRPGERRSARDMKVAFTEAAAIKGRRRLRLGGDRTTGRGLVGFRVVDARGSSREEGST